MMVNHLRAPPPAILKKRPNNKHLKKIGAQATSTTGTASTVYQNTPVPSCRGLRGADCGLSLVQNPSFSQVNVRETRGCGIRFGRDREVPPQS